MVIDCPRAAERDLASLYLAGKLGKEEAEAFEEHFFACESCRLDVERGSELRAMFGKAPVVPAARPTSSVRAWLPLAAAALVAIVGVGVWQLNRRTAMEPGVLRSAGAAIADLKVSSRAGGGFELSWAPQPRAATYAVEVFASDETRVWKTLTREPRVSIEPAALPAAARSQTYEIRVEALDALGQVVASSEASATQSP